MAAISRPTPTNGHTKGSVKVKILLMAAMLPGASSDGDAADGWTGLGLGFGLEFELGLDLDLDLDGAKDIRCGHRPPVPGFSKATHAAPEGLADRRGSVASSILILIISNSVRLFKGFPPFFAPQPPPVPEKSLKMGLHRPFAAL